jgi:tRNA (mo5U34)-methyltransferase
MLTGRRSEFLSMSNDELAAEVARHEWYHTIDLGGGIVTPGFFDHRPFLHHYDFPPTLRGSRVLDVGTFDGFFAFHMERLGADEVVAIDVPDLESLDWPAPWVGKPTRFQPRHENFEIAKRALGSRVLREFVSTYEVARDELGEFDYVFVGSVLVHLRDPVRALTALRDVCRGEIHVTEATDSALDDVGRGTGLARFQALSDHFTWWIPNRRCLEEWLLAAGFTDVTHGDTFMLPFAGSEGQVRHSVVHGSAGPTT